MKQRTLINLALFPVVLVLILALALLTLDLNPYRDQIVWSLEKSFSRQVRFSSIELTFLHGLALELHDLEVGTEQDTARFQTESGVFRLQIIPLLQGELNFNEIRLTRPDLHVRLPENNPGQQQEASPSIISNLTGFKALELVDARISIEGLGRNDTSLTLENIDLSLKGLQPGKTCTIDLEGNLETGGSRTQLSLHSRVQIPLASETWVDRNLDVQFNAKGIERRQWQTLLPPTLATLLPEEPFNIYLALFKNPNDGFSFTMTVRSNDTPQQCDLPNLTLKMENATLEGSYGGGETTYDLDLRGSGELESCGNNIARFNLRQTLESNAEKTRLESTIESDVDVRETMAWLAYEPLKFTAEGRIPITLSVAGTTDLASWELSSTLTPLALHWGKTMIKTPGIAGSLEAQGELGNRTPLKSGRIELGELRATLNASDTRDPEFTLELEPSGLHSLEEIVPALAQWEISGTASGELKFKKTKEHWQRSGSIELTDISVSHPYPLAAARQSSARLTITDNRLDFLFTPLRLGESQLQVRGHVPDMRDPQFVIHAETPSMLARDLVFKRPGARLNDLVGTLHIDGKGIDFIDCRVLLDEGTDASVDGHLDFQGNRLDLNVTSDYGQIDEVIRLFVGPQRWNHPAPADHGRAESTLVVVVKAHAREGDIGGVHFEEARGSVRVSNGEVEVYPLSFAGQGQGRATARVFYASRPGLSGWLRVSGSLRGFDATTLHSQYWKRRGDIKGPLDSDFFLQGPSDKSFFSRGKWAVYL